jgi:hypothetical protein
MRLQRPNGISATALMSIICFGIILAGMKFQKANRTRTRLKQTMQKCATIWLAWLDHPVVSHAARMHCIVRCAYLSFAITIANSKVDSFQLTLST